MAFPYASAIPVPETTIGLALEETRDTPVSPTNWFPATGPKYKPNLKMLEVKVLEGSMVDTYDMVPGQRFDSHGWDGLLFLDSIPMLVRGELGSPDTKTVAGSATTLSSAATAGATTITTAAALAVGDFAVIDSGVGVQETVQVLSVSSDTSTLAYPLQFAHAESATVTPLTGHAFSLLNNSPSTRNQPPSYTITDYAGDSWRQIPGAQLDELTFSGSSDSLPKYTVTWAGNSAITPSSPTASYTTVEAAPGWTAQCSIGGTQVTNLETWEIGLKRGVKQVPAITGTQNYYQQFAGPLVPSCKVTVLGSTDEPQMSAYLAGEVQIFDLSLSDVDNGYIINYHCTTSKYTGADVDRSKEYVEIPLTIELLPNSTDATAGGVSPIEIQVGNGTTTSY